MSLWQARVEVLVVALKLAGRVWSYGPWTMAYLDPSLKAAARSRDFTISCPDAYIDALPSRLPHTRIALPGSCCPLRAFSNLALRLAGSHGARSGPKFVLHCRRAAALLI